MAELKHTEDSSASGVCKNGNNHIREKLVELISRVQDYGEKIRSLNGSYSFVERNDNRVIADHLIANGVTVQEWIPVTERLPKEGDIVLCYMEFGEQRMAQWDESENCWAGQLIDYHKEQVTHWMPMPTPPKGDTDEA